MYIILFVNMTSQIHSKKYVYDVNMFHTQKHIKSRLCYVFFLELQGIILSDKYINRMMSHNEFAVVANSKMKITQ